MTTNDLYLIKSIIKEVMEDADRDNKIKELTSRIERIERILIDTDTETDDEPAIIGFQQQQTQPLTGEDDDE